VFGEGEGDRSSLICICLNTGREPGLGCSPLTLTSEDDAGSDGVIGVGDGTWTAACEDGVFSGGRNRDVNALFTCGTDFMVPGTTDSSRDRRWDRDDHRCDSAELGRERDGPGSEVWSLWFLV
jgi:hypothetical protein